MDWTKKFKNSEVNKQANRMKLYLQTDYVDEFFSQSALILAGNKLSKEHCAILLLSRITSVVVRKPYFM